MLLDIQSATDQVPFEGKPARLWQDPRNGEETTVISGQSGLQPGIRLPLTVSTDWVLVPLLPCLWNLHDSSPCAPTSSWCFSRSPSPHLELINEGCGGSQVSAPQDSPHHCSVPLLNYHKCFLFLHRTSLSSSFPQLSFWPILLDHIFSTPTFQLHFVLYSFPLISLWVHFNLHFLHIQFWAMCVDPISEYLMFAGRGAGWWWHGVRGHNHETWRLQEILNGIQKHGVNWDLKIWERLWSSF